LKAGQSQLADFESWPEPTRQFFKASQSKLANFGAGQILSRQFSKAFRKFKRFSRLTAKNLLIQYKIKRQ
jgi:hypothetical protein